MENKEFEKLKEKIEFKIAISNFEKEEKMDIGKNKKKIVKGIAVASVLLFSMTGVVFANSIGGFFKDFFGKNSSDGVDRAVNNGYVENIDSNYQNSDGIEINVDSVIMDDFNFAINFNVKLDEKYNIDDFEKTELKNLKVLDEEENIVFNTKDVQYETEEEMREKGYNGSYSFLAEKIDDNNFKLSLSATGSDKLFPKSKQLIITFTGINTWKYEEDKRVDTIYEGDWNFKFDVKEEFYNRETIIYKAVSCSDNSIDINQVQAVLSNTAFKIYIPTILTDKVNYELLNTSTPKNISDKIAIQKEYVENENKEKFETSMRSDGDGGYSIPENENKIVEYHQTFNLTKYDATNTIKVHMFTNTGEEIIVTLHSTNEM